MSLDPVRTSQGIEEAYLNYLSTTFRLRDPDLQDQLETALRERDKFTKGPILEATPPFEAGDPISALVKEKVLSPRFLDLDSESLPPDRPLYLHQEQAIRTLIEDSRNAVVATGTGSGKTETFLIPILNHLYTEMDRGALGPGVRALLLYPMNALANDQMTRLRGLLANLPEVTFGRYTGETEQTTKKALERYRKMFKRDPLPNELISRDQMRETPPHFLLTNYAMLEYLLLRPDDNVFFDGPDAAHWKFLVIDEAHTYSGAKGIEMAMLMRRLKDRVAPEERGKLRCMATSATLGRGVADFPEVAEFARKLFNEQFSWEPNDPQKQDVIAATRKPVAVSSKPLWRASPSFYIELASMVERGATGTLEIQSLVQEAGLPTEVIRTTLQHSGTEQPEQAFYQLLVTSEELIKLQESLEQEPCFLGDAARLLFQEDPQAEEATIALVDLAVKARPEHEDAALLPARYHFFVRAIEGAFVSFAEQPDLYLERREHVQKHGDTIPVFELAVCKQCGGEYLVGEHEEDVDGNLVLRQPGKNVQEDAGNLVYYYLLPDRGKPLPADEDELVTTPEEADEGDGSRFELCTHCGAIDHENLIGDLCDCDTAYRRNLLKASSKQGKVHYCPACGSRSPISLVRRFLTGNDATASVLATALYQHIRPREVTITTGDDISETDAWSSTASRPEPSENRDAIENSGRQLLIFSDSRQDAAFFAPYLNRTYNQILRRRLILETLENHIERVTENRWRVQDLVQPLRVEASRSGIFRGMGPQEQETEAWKWILFELLAHDRRNSLEGVGQLGFRLVKPDTWTAPAPLLSWGLSEEEVWTLFELLLDTIRIKGAVVFPELVSPRDPFFSPRNRDYYFRGEGSNSRRGVLSWIPSSKGSTNARLDILLRFVDRNSDINLSRDECIEVLDRIWGSSLELHNSSSCWRDYFIGAPLSGEGVVFQMRPNYWELKPTALDPSIEWYYCPICNSFTLHNLRGVCPTYQCRGELQPAKPSQILSGNHYRNLYTSLVPSRLIAHEHTAQLTSEAAAELQTQFVNGEVNVLSCSTTFELGVDVGQLETVFMRNVPPSAANYVQRAGRAGRRTSSTAYALTFAQRRPHDLTHFSEPKRMITGEIRAPYFEMANEKIVLRHLYATALAGFWKEHPDTFQTVSSFFFREGRTGPDLLTDYLDSKPQQLLESVKRIVPSELVPVILAEPWQWVDGLAGSNGALRIAADSVQADVDQLEEARRLRIEKNQKSDYILGVISNLQRRYLLNYLSSQNVIPKYGFPVDVVSLQILHHAAEARGLELDRDLRIALSEYAPSGQVVAGGKLWTSRYIKELPDRAWRKYRYAICPHCQCYQSVLSDTDQQLSTCITCHQPLHGREQGTFIIPEFGFMTDTRKPGKPGESRPERTYSTRTYFSGRAGTEDRAELNLDGTRVVAISAPQGELAVINHAGYRGFNVCHWCGYTQLVGESLPDPHSTPWGADCEGRPVRMFLGHEFKTDVLQLRFDGYSKSSRGFWLSLLYALLEGMSAGLDIDRQDIDGTLYPYAGDPNSPAVVLFDDVPGGAGHVRRVVTQPEMLEAVLNAAYDRLARCDCGGDLMDTSCYGCLRNYRNQYCHDLLQRGPTMQFLKQLLR